MSVCARCCRQTYTKPFRPHDNLRAPADARFAGQSEARAQFSGNRGGRRATRANPVAPQLASVTNAPFTGRSLASDSYQGQQGEAVQRMVRGAMRQADHRRAVSGGAPRFQGQTEAQASYQAQVGRVTQCTRRRGAGHLSPLDVYSCKHAHHTCSPGCYTCSLSLLSGGRSQRCPCLPSDRWHATTCWGRTAVPGSAGRRLPKRSPPSRVSGQSPFVLRCATTATSSATAVATAPRRRRKRAKPTHDSMG